MPKIPILSLEQDGGGQDGQSLDDFELILYGDEVTPGNTLKATNFRKVWSMYWGIKGKRC